MLWLFLHTHTHTHAQCQAPTHNAWIYTVFDLFDVVRIISEKIKFFNCFFAAKKKKKSQSFSFFGVFYFTPKLLFFVVEAQP